MTPESDNQSPEDHLRQLIPNVSLFQMLYVAVKLGIAELLHEEAKSAEHLAKITAVDGASLYRVLRALASQGIFAESENHEFMMTATAELLRSDVPGSLRDRVLWLGEPFYWQSYGELLHSVRTGETAIKHVFGTELFDYLAHNIEAAAVFNQEMTNMTQVEGAAVAAAYDFGKAQLVVDIGGGHGTLMSLILAKNPTVQGLIFDLPDVVFGAQEILKTAGVADRCNFVGGSFFESLPEDGDIYILKDILHDWNDEQVTSILRNCRRAMTGGKLLIVERIIPPGNAAHNGKIIDVTMLVLTGGKERTEAEYRDLLRGARFEVSRIVPTTAGTDIIEALPA